MKAVDLKPGDLFKLVDNPEEPERICLFNNGATIRWGYPGKSQFWCFMGHLCDVVVTGTRVLGFLQKDRQEKFSISNRGWYVNAWRIVDAFGKDRIQPWFNTKTESRATAKQLGITLMEVGPWQ